MTELRDAALEYAARGWRVFPLHGIINGACTCGRAHCGSAGKHPLVRRGLYEATTDARLIREWWRRWRSANIGVATGTGSGIVVIDIDLPTAFDPIGRLLELGVGPTLTGLTGGGGVHLVYRSRDQGLGTSAGRLPGVDGELPGIDLRGNGGYIVAPPSVHRSGSNYLWLDGAKEPAPAPKWLKQPDRSFVPVDVVEPAGFDGDGTAYGCAALSDSLSSLRRAPVGQRNHTLNRVTFALAQLVAGGELLGSTVRAGVIAAALDIGLDEGESRQTVDSAFAAGLRSPRVAPHRMKGSV